MQLLPGFTAEAALSERVQRYKVADTWARTMGAHPVIPQDWPVFGPPSNVFCSPECTPGLIPGWQMCCRPSPLGYLC